MRVYLVGGAVRDRLLGLPIRERDWVVTGTTPAEMCARGFEQIDGAFPVYRHPRTGDEYALARVETKQGSGHRGFRFDYGPEISLEQDLARRDLSVNAIAEDAEGKLIDPFDGLAALRDRRLVHVTQAFVEDPLRLLRTARFAACLAHLGFKVEYSTLSLMTQMAATGEPASLSSERVWRELSLALRSPTPRVVFDVLRDCGAAPALLPALPPASLEPDSRAMRALAEVAMLTTDLEARFAAFIVAGLADFNRALAESTARALNAGASEIRAASRVASIGAALSHECTDVGAYWLGAIEAGDGLRQQIEFHQVLPAVDTLIKRPGTHRTVSEQLAIALNAAARVDVKPLAEAGMRGPALGKALRESRLRAVAAGLAD